MRLSDFSIGDIVQIATNWVNTPMTSTKGYLKGATAVVCGVDSAKGMVRVWNTSAVPTVKKDGSPDLTTYRSVHPDDIVRKLPTGTLITVADRYGNISGLEWTRVLAAKDTLGLSWLPTLRAADIPTSPATPSKPKAPKRSLFQYTGVASVVAADAAVPPIGVPNIKPRGGLMDTLVEANKSAMITTGEIKIGKMAIKAVGALAKKHLPFYTHGYIDMPLMKFAIGNSLAYGIDRFGHKCSRISQTDLCEFKKNIVVASQLELAEMIDLDALVSDVFKAVEGLTGSTKPVAANEGNKAGHSSQILDADRDNQ